MAGSAGTENYNAAGNSDFSRKAMELAGEAIERWATPSDISKRGGSQSPEKRRAGGHAVNIEDQAENWAAPQARDHFPPHSPERIAASEKWSSPKASDPEKAGPNMRGSKGDVPLPGQAANWPGPDTVNRVRDPETLAKCAAFRLRNAGQKTVPLYLAEVAELHFLPPSFPAQPIPAGSKCSTASPNSNQPSAKRKLNPIFVEALMRWPTGLSGFERQETAWTQWWQLQRSYLSALDWGSSAPGTQAELI